MLKQLVIPFILVLGAFQALSQDNTLDSLMFAKINSYRVDSGLPELKWDDRAYNMAKHHSEYMLKLNIKLKGEATIKGHGENEDIDNFEELPTVWDRFKKYVGEIFELAENIRENFIVGTNSSPVDNKINIEKIIESWKKSLGHNKNLLNESATFGACSFQEKTIEVDGKKIKYFVATLDIF